MPNQTLQIVTGGAMGAWGDSILADDDAQDVYHQYRRLYNQGMEHAKVRRELERTWADSIADSDDGPVFWFAVARAQWEFGALDPDVRRRIEEIAEKGLGLDRWREGGPRMLAKREKVVREFLDKIRQPNPKPKKRKVEKRYPPIYQPGDCLAIELMDGSFGALIVLATDDTHAEGIDEVAFLEWHAHEPPPLSFFDERRFVEPKGWVNTNWMGCLASCHRSMKGRLRLIGRVPLRADDPKCKGPGAGGRWEHVAGVLEGYYGLRTSYP
jgi:hypothetical protein